MNDIKIAIITDTEINYLYREDDDIIHAELFKKYIIDHYLSDEIEQVDLNNANNMALFLREKGNIIFINDTTYVNDLPGKHGKTGIVIFPNEISEYQKEEIMNFNQNIIDYDGLQVWYDFESHMECKTIFTRNKSQVSTIIEYALDKIKIKKRSR